MSDSEVESESDYEDFDNGDELSLFEIKGGTTPDHGGLKSFKTKDGGLVYYSDDPSGFTVSVERLLQVDGFEDDTEEQRMTLIVLKVVLASNDLGKVIEHVSFSMQFAERRFRKKAKPRLLAWAPFDSMVRSNKTTVNAEQTFTSNAKLGGAGGGATGELSLGYEKKISWSPTYFASGNAFPLMDTDTEEETQERIGVRWVLASNPKEVSGVPPAITVAMLLSRATDEPYLAKFNVRVTGGRAHDLLRDVKTIVGMKPGTTQPYKVTPSKRPIKRGEGQSLYEQAKINPKALGKLRGKGELTNLTLVWGDEDEAKEKEDDAEAAAEDK
jgi:hypothetical protein